jgi:hypothetical protein
MKKTHNFNTSLYDIKNADSDKEILKKIENLLFVKINPQYYFILQKKK